MPNCVRAWGPVWVQSRLHVPRGECVTSKRSRAERFRPRERNEFLAGRASPCRSDWRSANRSRGSFSSRRPLLGFFAGRLVRFRGRDGRSGFRNHSHHLGMLGPGSRHAGAVPPSGHLPSKSSVHPLAPVRGPGRPVLPFLWFGERARRNLLPSVRQAPSATHLNLRPEGHSFRANTAPLARC